MLMSIQRDFNYPCSCVNLADFRIILVPLGGEQYQSSPRLKGTITHNNLVDFLFDTINCLFPRMNPLEFRQNSIATFLSMKKRYFNSLILFITLISYLRIVKDIEKDICTYYFKFYSNKMILFGILGHIILFQTKLYRFISNYI